jgi:Zn-dependent protease
MMFGFPDLREILISIPPLLFALSFHEFAHGFIADRMGDPTPRYYGRLTLNPLAHLDPLGTLMLIFYHFGWAKPVPVNPYNFTHRERGLLLVSLAGPLSNILLAFVGNLALRAAIIYSSNQVLVQMLQYFWQINVLLAAFNLIPIPPLDGSKILAGLLPPKQAFQFRQLESYGPIILLFLVFFDILGRIIYPLGGLLMDAINLFTNMVFPLY